MEAVAIMAPVLFLGCLTLFWVVFLTVLGLDWWFSHKRYLASKRLAEKSEAELAALGKRLDALREAP